MTKFFFKFKKPYFSTTFDPFPQFWGKKNFLKNWAVVHILALCQNSEKSHDPIPRKHPHRCQEGRMERPYFIVSFQLLPEVTSTIAAD